MSTVAELVEGLEKTGTRGRKLDHLQRIARDKKYTSAAELVEFLEAEQRRNSRVRTVTSSSGGGGWDVDENDFERQTGIGPVTIAKAKHLAAGRPIDDLMGKPPRDYEEEKNRRLALVIVETLEAQKSLREDLAAEASIPKTAAAVKKIKPDPAEQREQAERAKDARKSD